MYLRTFHVFGVLLAKLGYEPKKIFRLRRVISKHSILQIFPLRRTTARPYHFQTQIHMHPGNFPSCCKQMSKQYVRWNLFYLRRSQPYFVPYKFFCCKNHMYHKNHGYLSNMVHGESDEDKIKTICTLTSTGVDIFCNFDKEVSIRVWSSLFRKLSTR